MLVVVEDGGGLANRLFVFANVIATGLATGHRVANPAFRRWSGFFEGTVGDSLSVFPRRPHAIFGGRSGARVAASLSFRCSKAFARFPSLGPLRVFNLHWPHKCDLDAPETLFDIQRRRIVLLKGWLFRNATGMESHSTQIREFFRPVSSIRIEADRMVDAARQQGDFLVGVHVRHRDYRNFMNGRYFYPFSTYIALMNSVVNVLASRRVVFLVCSDEVQDPSIAGDLPVVFSTQGPVQDLWALSRCDLIMGPPSTFSAWAAFLGETPLWEVDDPHMEFDPTTPHLPWPVPRVPTEDL